MLGYILGILCFSLGFSSVLCQSSNQTTLLCYDCDPMHSSEDCHIPNDSNAIGEAPVRPCEMTTGNETNVCLSAYIENIGNSNASGVHRGCYQVNSDVQDFCDWFKEVKNDSGIVKSSSM